MTAESDTIGVAQSVTRKTIIKVRLPTFVSIRFHVSIPQIQISELLLRAVLLGLLFAARRIPTFTREVQWPDWHRYNFPIAVEQRVDSFALYMLVIGGYICIALITFLASTIAFSVPSFGRLYNGSPYDDDRRRSYSQFIIHEQLRLLWGISLSFLLTGIVTNVIKNWAGRPRPDFLSRCQPEGFDLQAPQFQLLPTIPKCTGNEAEIVEGRRSFPSGHSSYSFSIYGFIALVFYHHLLFPCAHLIGGWRLVSFVAALMPPLYCGISRTMDYRHHWDDVFIGSFMGFCFSYVCYYVYYPHCPTKQKSETLVDDPSEVISQRYGPDGYESVNVRI